MTIGIVQDLLRCPQCLPQSVPLTSDDPTRSRTVRCDRGHSFDIARQGQLNLLGRSQPRHADTAAMVAAREVCFGSGVFDAVTAALAKAVPRDTEAVADIGAGPALHLTAVVSADRRRRGLALDVSVAAARRAARAHPRIGSVVADGWQPWPIADRSVDLAISAFAPRHGKEFARILRPTGRLITITPLPQHLLELRHRFGLLEVDPDKDRRLAATLEYFAIESATDVVENSRWTSEQAAAAIAMGPNAFHSVKRKDLELGDFGGGPVTVACRISRWRPKDS